MKWIVALLLLANAVFYLWIGERADHGQPVPFAQPEVNREGMLLLHELATADQPPAPATTTPAPATPAPTETACYRIGPFKKNADWLAANRWMKDQQLNGRAVRSQSREMRAVRVFVGPFDSRAQAQPMMERLADREIHHFTDPTEHRQVRISLGYFIQEALAAKFIAHLRSQGIEANSRPEYRVMGPFDWLEASINPTQRAALLSHDWHEKGAAVLAIDCDEISLPPS